jgi:hypothetical protein
MNANRNRPSPRGRGRQSRNLLNRNVVQQDVVSMMNPVPILPPADPPETLNVVETTQQFSMMLTVPTGSTATPFTVANIMTNIPGSTTFWQEVRFEKFMIYGTDNVEATGLTRFLPLQVNIGSSALGGTLSLRDDGTSGAQRARVGFRLGLLGRAQWRNPAATDALFTVNQSNITASQLLRLIVTVSLKSPNTNSGF